MEILTFQHRRGEILRHILYNNRSNSMLALFETLLQINNVTKSDIVEMV